MDTWHHENNPEGSTVEMHGNIRSAAGRVTFCSQQQFVGDTWHNWNQEQLISLDAAY
jgi:hypothetical protein